MGEQDEHSSEACEPVQLERVLTEALRARSLGAEALARIRANVHSEWRAQHPGAAQAAPRKARTGLWISLAAVLLATLAAVWFLSSQGTTAPFGTVARLDVGAAEGRVGFFHTRLLAPGDVLVAGTVLQTRGPMLVALAGGGTLRIAPNTHLKLEGPTTGVLKRGQIYVELPPDTTARSPFEIRTRAGRVQHVGTAFEVLSNEEFVRLRVREGLVNLIGASRAVSVDAGSELTAMNDGTVLRGRVPTYGPDWLWVAALAPDVEIEGKPLVDFLGWASRELGRPVKFADDNARAVAARTILHGSVRGREPLDALSSVLSSTSLTYEIRGDAIWIESGHAT